MRSKNLAIKTITMSMATIFGKLLGFVKNAFLAAMFGATAETDAFYMAVNITNILTGAASGMSTVIIPTRAERLSAEGQEAADSFTSSLLNISLLMSVLLSAAAMVFAPSFVHLFAPNFSGSQYTLTVLITRCCLPTMIFVTALSIFSGILNMHQSFAVVQLAVIPLDVAWMIIPIFMAKHWGIFSMVIGYLVGMGLQALVLIPALRKFFHYSFHMNLQDPLIKKTLKLSMPVFVGTYALIINQAVDKALASTLDSGNISALNYATLLVSLVQGIVILPICTTLYSSLSSHAQQKDTAACGRLLGKSVVTMLILLVPTTAFCLYFSLDIISIIYGRGAFDSNAQQLTSTAFFYYALSFVPLGLSGVLMRYFYATQNTKVPMIVSILGMGVNILANVILVGPMQVGGLALGTSISQAATCVLLALYLHRYNMPLHYREHFFAFLKIAAATAAAIAVAWGIRNLFPSMIYVKLILSALCGGAVYALTLVLLRLDDAVAVFYSLQSFIKKWCHKADGVG